MRRWIVIAAVFCAGVAVAESQPPAPSASKAGGPEKAHTSEPNKNGSHETGSADKWAPTLFNVVAPQITQSPSNNQAEKSHDGTSWKGVWDALIAIGTIALAIVTSVLVYYTRGLLIEAKKQFPHFLRNVEAMARSAKAARRSVNLSRREFVSTHRPKVHVRHIWPAGELWGGGAIAVTVEIVNRGLTTAKIVDHSVRTIVHPVDRPLPIPPQYQIAIRTTPPRELESGQVAQLNATARAISDEDNANIRDGASVFYCFGYIRYEDRMGRIQTTAFCRMLSPPQQGVTGAAANIGRFVRVTGNSREYEYKD